MGAEQGVVGTAHIVATETRDGVVEGRYFAPLAGQRGGEWGVGMHDGARVRSAEIKVTMQMPLTRRRPQSVRLTRKRHPDDVVRANAVRVQATRRDQQTVAAARTDIAGTAAVQSQREQLAGGIHQGLAQGVFIAMTHDSPRLDEGFGDSADNAIMKGVGKGTIA